MEKTRKIKELQCTEVILDELITAVDGEDWPASWRADEFASPISDLDDACILSSSKSLGLALEELLETDGSREAAETLNDVHRQLRGWGAAGVELSEKLEDAAVTRKMAAEVAGMAVGFAVGARTAGMTKAGTKALLRGVLRHYLEQ